MCCSAVRHNAMKHEIKKLKKIFNNARAIVDLLMVFLTDFSYNKPMNKTLIKHLGILSIFIFVSGCTLKSRTPENKLPLKLYVFECGENDVKDIRPFAPDLSAPVAKKMVVSCFLIQHPNGTLLWDSGLSDELAKKPEGLDVMGGNFHLSVRKPFLEKLADIGILPKDITFIAFSHFHSDHVGNANAFSGSTLLIQKEEYQAAFSDEPEKFRYTPQTYMKLKHTPAKLLQGDYDVFGDGSVVIKRAIGHTPGHQVLFVRLPKTGPILLSGDLYHFADNRTYKRVPIFNFNQEESKKSIEEIEAFVRETNAKMWIQHDYPQIFALRHAPLFYE